MADEGYQPFPEISAWTAVPFDPTTYEQYAALLEQARAEASEEAREHAVKTAMRYAGTDTGAIEGLYTTDRGFTRTVAIEAAGWEAAANERGPNAAEIIKDQIAAYEWVLDLVTQERPVTEHVIRELHAMLCRSQETYVVHTPAGRQERPLPKGAYKEFPNNPTSLATGQIHHYAPPDMVGPEMARLVAAMGSDEYAAAHPVVQAAFVHYALAAIHPFADGNGRVSRALASVPLYRAIRVPLLVLRDERDDYLDALGAADTGALDAFVAFVAQHVVDAAELVRMTLRLGTAPSRERSLGVLRDAGTGVRGLSHAELDALATRLIDACEETARDHITRLPLPSGVTITPRRVHGDQPSPPTGYRLPNALVSMEIEYVSPPPAAFQRVIHIAVFVATDDDHPLLVLTASPGTCPDAEFAVRDVVPAVREIANVRLAHWVDCVLDVVLADLADIVREFHPT